MDLHSTYPGLSDLRRRAQRRIPKFVWEYLDSGTGTEATKARNRIALDKVLFNPSILHGEFTADLTTQFLGKTYPLPVGIAPVGMSGLIWPDAEGHLARAAARAGIPYTLSTVASQMPEDIAPHLVPVGVIVNGLVVAAADDTELAAYYRSYVIRGAGAFVETARGFEDYAAAMERKLLRELQSIAIGSL